ncbi:MAG: glycosyltransferase [Acidobacteria bacterium]|nr:MAG: glycosyltransferase [Acidobacteriota bacterium]
MQVLMLTYPGTPVGPAACGGTEQMAFLLLRAWSQQREFAVTWVGAAGSVHFPNVEFIAWESLPGGVLPPAGWDLIHNEGAFAVRTAFAPTLFTLHLARSLYPAALFAERPATLHFQCVSRGQWQLYGEAVCCGYIANGIDLQQFPVRHRAAANDAPLLYLGRICPEKAPHLAIAAARQAKRRLWLVGAVAPFPAHQEYFRRQIAPQLGSDICWIRPPDLDSKRTLFQEAAAVLIPSRIAETSSIVAMEAAASGVPVLATRAGALPEIVADGETGFLGSPDDFPGFLDRLAQIDPHACRDRAERLFSSARMIASYAALYRRLASHPHAARSCNL